MIILRNDAENVTITYLDAPMNGKPLTRVWAGPMPDLWAKPGVCVEAAGDTPAGRDTEVVMLTEHPTFREGWRVLPDPLCHGDNPDYYPFGSLLPY